MRDSTGLIVFHGYDQLATNAAVGRACLIRRDAGMRQALFANCASVALVIVALVVGVVAIGTMVVARRD
jgi:hypothetical protein